MAVQNKAKAITDHIATAEIEFVEEGKCVKVNGSNKKEAPACCPVATARGGTPEKTLFAYTPAKPYEIVDITARLIAIKVSVVNGTLLHPTKITTPNTPRTIPLHFRKLKDSFIHPHTTKAVNNGVRELRTT